MMDRPRRQSAPHDPYVPRDFRRDYPPPRHEARDDRGLSTRRESYHDRGGHVPRSQVPSRESQRSSSISNSSSRARASPPPCPSPELGSTEQFFKSISSLIEIACQNGALQFQQSLASTTLASCVKDCEESQKLGEQYVLLKQFHLQKRENSQLEISRLGTLIQANKNQQQLQMKATAQAIFDLVQNQLQSNMDVKKLRQDLQYSREKIDLLSKGQDTFSTAIQMQRTLEAKFTALQMFSEKLQKDLDAVKDDTAGSSTDAPTKKDLETLEAEIGILQRDSQVAITANSSIGERVQLLEESLKTIGIERDTSVVHLGKELDSIQQAQETMVNEIDGAVEELEKRRREDMEQIEKNINKITSTFTTEVDLLKAQKSEFDTIHTDVERRITSLSKAVEELHEKYRELLGRQQQQIEQQAHHRQRQQQQQQQQRVHHQPTNPIRNPNASPPTLGQPQNGTPLPSNVQSFRHSSYGNCLQMNQALHPQTPQEIQTLMNGFVAHTDHINALLNAVRNLDSRFNNLTTEPLVRAMSQVMFNMYPHARNIDQELIELKTKLETLSSQFNDQSKSPSTAKEADAFRAEMASLRDQMSSYTHQHQQDFATLTTSIEKLELSLREIADVCDRNTSLNKEHMEALLDAKKRLENEISAIKRHVNDTTSRIEENLQTEMAKQTLLYAGFSCKINRVVQGNRDRVVTPSSPVSNANKENNAICGNTMLVNGGEDKDRVASLKEVEWEETSDDEMPLKHRRARQTRENDAGFPSSPVKDTVVVAATGTPGPNDIRLGQRQFLNKKRRL